MVDLDHFHRHLNSGRDNQFSISSIDGDLAYDDLDLGCFRMVHDGHDHVPMAFFRSGVLCHRFCCDASRTNAIGRFRCCVARSTIRLGLGLKDQLHTDGVANDMSRLTVPMRTVFQDVLLLTYSVPPEGLQALLPAPVFPWVHNRRAFISIVVANMRAMRPKGLPELIGANAYQIVYRAVVEVRPTRGDAKRGVFFLRSDCNDGLLSYIGNRMTEFRFHYFHRSAINWFARGEHLLVSAETKDKGGDLVQSLRNMGPAVEPSPLFGSIDEEKAHLVELFNAYAYDPEREVVLDMEIERGTWELERLQLEEGFSAFFEEAPFTRSDARPVSQLAIRECAYIWNPMKEYNATDMEMHYAPTDPP